tara:strand:- start:5623 stop:5829 length:207 start_codon:yes stop_codon:yes gene_type:complete
MFNVGYQTYSNLDFSKVEEKTEDTGKSMGLLSRNMQKPETKKELNPRQRVAKYVAELRKARMELKNGN